MRLHTFSNGLGFVVAILATLNIIFYSFIEIGSINIVNNKTSVKLIDSKDKKVKIPFISFIIILALSIIICMIGLFLTNDSLFIITIILLALIVLILSIVSIVYFSKLDLNNSYNLNIGNIINVKQNEGGVILIKLTTYVFFGLSIIASILNIASSYTR
jgi:hypothetical protein